MFDNFPLSEAFWPNSSSLSFLLQLWFPLVWDEQGVEGIHLDALLHLFKGLHKTDTPYGARGGVVASIDDSTTASTPKPSHAAPNLSSPPPMDSILAAHLHTELCLL